MAVIMGEGSFTPEMRALSRKGKDLGEGQLAISSFSELEPCILSYVLLYSSFCFSCESDMGHWLTVHWDWLAGFPLPTDTKSYIGQREGWGQEGKMQPESMKYLSQLVICRINYFLLRQLSAHYLPLLRKKKSIKHIWTQKLEMINLGEACCLWNIPLSSWGIYR